LDDIVVPGTFEFTSTARFASARNQTERALWLLRLRDPERPLFLMLHYMDTHQPRNPPENLIDDERRARPARESEVVYGASVRLVDAEFGRLIAELKERGRYAPSILVVTSDHGEGLEEQGPREGHGKNLYGELVWVPLAIKPAGAIPTRSCDGLISHIDLGSTLLLLAGINEDFGVGQPRVAHSGECADGADAVFHAMTSRPPSSDGLVSGGSAVVWNHPDHWLSYDLERDPDYQHPSAIEAEPHLEEHVQAQRELAHRAGPTNTREFDPELVETLHALGYLQ
jgi:arylsulfatase A-like enzyme